MPLSLLARRTLNVVTAIVLCAGLAACASVRDQASGTVDIKDPLENVNRAVFSFNEAADRYVLEPVAKTYRTVLPQEARNGIRNFLRNLRSPIIIANQLLQGDFRGARNATERLVINTLAGAGGLIDVAGEHGWAFEDEDFGQTLAKWGVDPGPYLVLPLLGPSSLRDTAGYVVDVLADPVGIYLYANDLDELAWARFGTNAIDARSRLIEAVNDLRRNSVDYYATVRSLYAQRRASAVADQSATADIPDYGDDTDAPVPRVDLLR